MDSYKSLNVFFNKKLVGTLAIHQNQSVAFEYAAEWIQHGFSINPYLMPLRSGLFIPKNHHFDGLHGVFNDSLPDGWGRLIVDRMLLKKNVSPYHTHVLDRLAIVGDSGMGALTYKPTHPMNHQYETLDLDYLAGECKKILESTTIDDLDTLFALGGSSGGARPKILTTVDGEDWIIKFPSSMDSKDIGIQEYQYSIAAKLCGIDMTETRLFESKQCGGYFGTKRFDRTIKNDCIQKKHMVTVSGILETSHRYPNLDYHDLMKLTTILTKDMREVLKMYRLMCFNVYAHNRDDHSKNFTFIYNEDERQWQLSPAYDLTHSYSIGGEHATTINGNGKDPSLNDILSVAEKAGIEKNAAKMVANEVQEIANTHLSKVIKK